MPKRLLSKRQSRKIKAERPYTIARHGARPNSTQLGAAARMVLDEGEASDEQAEPMHGDNAPEIYARLAAKESSAVGAAAAEDDAEAERRADEAREIARAAGISLSDNESGSDDDDCAARMAEDDDAVSCRSGAGGAGEAAGAAAVRFVMRDGVRVTRGSIQLRFKMEWWELRKRIKEMRAESRKKNRHVLLQKKAVRRSPRARVHRSTHAYVLLFCFVFVPIARRNRRRVCGCCC